MRCLSYAHKHVSRDRHTLKKYKIDKTSKTILKLIWVQYMHARTDLIYPWIEFSDSSAILCHRSVSPVSEL